MNKEKHNQEINYPPFQLKLTQEWFAGIITQCLGENETIQPYTIEGSLVAEEATRYIVPSPTQQPAERIQIYNQQYWWRLLNTLHANFPLVIRLFGPQAFNEKIGIPYLLKYPPHHWSLNLLGERLPKWIEECYHEPDQSLVLNAALLDWAFMASLITPRYPFPDLAQLIQKDPENLLSQVFYLQPHIHLFSWEYDLLTFRNSFLKQSVDYWLEHRFPKLPKGKAYFFILYRNLNNHLAWREISREEFTFLQCFKEGTNLSDACDYIETHEPSLYEPVASHLQQWIQEWVQAGWLTLTPKQQTYYYQQESE